MLPKMESRLAPDYPTSDDEFRARLEALERRPPVNYGVSGNGHAGKLTMWILGIFGAVATLLLSLTLQAVFNLRSDVSELRGQVSILVSDRNNNGRRP